MSVCVCLCVFVHLCVCTPDRINPASPPFSLSFSLAPSLTHTHTGAALWQLSHTHIQNTQTQQRIAVGPLFWCWGTWHFAFMEDYHKPDQQTVQALRNIANRLRINSIKATTAAGSGWVASTDSETWALILWMQCTVHAYKMCAKHNANLIFLCSMHRWTPIIELHTCRTWNTHSDMWTCKWRAKGTTCPAFVLLLWSTDGIICVAEI